MRDFNFQELDSMIHARIYGSAPGDVPAYSRQAEAARETMERVNASGCYRVYLKRVIGANGPQTAEWQCEVFSSDGTDVLATEIDGVESLAICRAINTANVTLAVR